ncbi:scm-like with four MBT domains protein 1 isoform X2 [Myzus persicae]|uniref:scm-like with four MBT domains protein 1 isoform X2 n=1 Tax=Myzus persicae TaxID=13164 RepID=UPI000B9382EA|nr:scm-like with four MBT domains protein 1 isoform X2 [Myzus persicae]
MLSSNSDDLLVEEKSFDCNKYLPIRNAEEVVPKDFFHHICKSEMNGIELGSVVEIENEDKSGYWFASVSLSKGVLINLHYFGDDNDEHDFWIKVNSSRIHSLNLGSENNKKLIPPHPQRGSLLTPEGFKEKVQDCGHAVSNIVLQMVLKNVGGRLFLQIQGTKSSEGKPFWLFYSNDSVFPLGWAEEKGLPWRVMNLDANFKKSTNSSGLLNVLEGKIPEQHGYKVGEMLEVINPYSLMEFYTATIVKVYDHRYFKVEVDIEIYVEKRISFVATKENPYLFNAGWANKHKFLLNPPSDWKKLTKFSWSKYILMKKLKLASVDILCRKNINHVHTGMKLEAVDPLNTDSIRVATVKGFADHWMFLSFDSTSCRQELLHVRSVYSDEVFPIGWCNKHKYFSSAPKLPYRNYPSLNGGLEKSLKISNDEKKSPIPKTVLQFKSKMKTMPISKKSLKKKNKSNISISSKCFKKRPVTYLEIDKVAEKVLDWSNEPLVAKYKNYLAKIISLDAHIIQLNQSNTELESSVIAEIISRKNDLRRMDHMSIFSNTKSKVETTEEKQFIVLDNWKTTFENYYRQNLRFKGHNIDIGQLEHIEITSNPKHWSPQDVYEYLINDIFCRDIALKLYSEEFDGVAFMLLNEEQLLKYLSVSINLAIRIMCHVAEAKLICLTKYCNEADS